MNNLYVVESPLQALCALEVSLKNSQDNNNILVCLSSNKRSSNNDQILNIIKIGKWSNFKVIKNSNHIQIFLYSVYFKYISRAYSEIDTLYIGEFRYLFMNLIRSIIDAPKVVLLDDGAATVNIIKNYIKKQIYHPNDLLYSPIVYKRIILKLLYKRLLNYEVLNKNISVFTSFSSDDREFGIKKIEFDQIKRRFNVENKGSNNKVYFFGSKYSEAGIISLDYEIKFIKDVVNYYKSKNKELVYYAHRDESDDKLDIISNTLKIKVKKNNKIAELELLEADFLPFEIAGAYTSVLNNIHVIFPELSTRGFRLKNSEIKPEYRHQITNLYNYYESIGISIEFT